MVRQHTQKSPGRARSAWRLSEPPRWEGRIQIPNSEAYEGGFLPGARKVGDNVVNVPRSLCVTEAGLERSWIRL